MINIIRSLKKYWVAIVFIVGLLAFQAVCDLSLPEFTSKIVNVGVQQSGIEEVVPKVISEKSMKDVLIFVDSSAKEDILSKYKLIRTNNKSTSDYKNYVKDYSLLKKENVYVLKNTKDSDYVKDIKVDFNKALLVYSMMTGEGKEAKELQDKIKKDMPVAYQQMEVIQLFKMMPEAQLIKMRENISDKFSKMPDSIVEQSAVAVIKTEYVKAGIDVNKAQTNYIIIAGLKMLGIALLSMVTTVIVGFLASKVAAKTARDLRNKVFTKTLGFSRAEYKKFGVSSLITRSTNDIQQVQMLMVMLLRIGIYAPILGVGGVFKVLQTNTSMAWIIAVAVVTILTVVIFMFGMVMPKFKIVQKLIDRLNQVTREIITGIPVVRAFSNQHHEEKRFDKASGDLKRTQLFVNRGMGFMMPTMFFIMNAICILIVWQGAHGIDTGAMQVGDMLAFIQYTMQIVMAFLMISMFSIMLPRANVAANRIYEVLNTEGSIKELDNPKEFSKRVQGLVEFKNVSFHYPDSDEDVLTDITFTSKPGTTTAFIGSTGSGKSTLINLIPRFYDVTRGEILVDGVNIKDVRQTDLNKKIGYVPQKGILFSGTIGTNIKYGDSSMSEEEMIKAARIAQATDFINAKENKFDDEISQGGTNVSGGQKQRLSIARAVAVNPEIYIFDDSFSALDFKTDTELRKALNKEVKESTVFIVAQRVSTILHADQIVVLDEGKVVGIGTHRELLKKCEVYKEIAASQLTKEELENA